MAGRNLAPTRTNLINLSHELQFAELGRELLDQKRNILVVELLNLVDQAVDAEQHMEDALNQAYHDLEEAVLRMGRLGVESVSSSINADAELSITQRRVMGVRLPVVDTRITGHAPY
ncbi:MAG: V-type ATP synthase subunit D, partial [Spirochaetales bacterium]|nr:V-type ATP synthase subunit D [Spirochaetales bacterium]